MRRPLPFLPPLFLVIIYCLLLVVQFCHGATTHLQQNNDNDKERPRQLVTFDEVGYGQHDYNQEEEIHPAPIKPTVFVPPPPFHLPTYHQLPSPYPMTPTETLPTPYPTMEASQPGLPSESESSAPSTPRQPSPTPDTTAPSATDHPMPSSPPLNVTTPSPMSATISPTGGTTTIVDIETSSLTPFQTNVIFNVTTSFLQTTDAEKILFLQTFLQSYNEANLFNPSIVDPLQRVVVDGDVLAADFALVIIEDGVSGGGNGNTDGNMGSDGTRRRRQLQSPPRVPRPSPPMPRPTLRPPMSTLVIPIWRLPYRELATNVPTTNPC
jgi:hypothetical protein